MYARFCGRRAAAPAGRRSRRSLRGLRRRTGATALLAVLVMMWLSTSAFAQLDPLLFIKRVPPTVIVVFDTSLQMLEDGNGNFYDPNYYKVADDADAMLAFPTINAPTKSYRRVYRNLQKAAGELHGRQHRRDPGALGSGHWAQLQQRVRPRLP